MRSASAATVEPTPETVIRLWREAERDLKLAPLGSDVYREREATVKELAGAYQRAVKERIREDADDELAQAGW